MSAFVELLGTKLLSSSGEVSTAEALAGKQAVALYFSAHWCPPCRGFTPKLAEWYSKNLQAKGLAVIFVSSDKDEASFQEYFGEQPWLALPFADRGQKDALSSKFKVQGIPTVVILDADGKTITKDGRSAIAADPEGEDFPWTPKSTKELLSGAKLLGKEGKEMGLEVLEGKVLALYFSAHWCPPCRGFTPKLAEWSSKSLQAKGLEVVFVSSDKDEASFQEYFGEQPWLALDYADRKRKDQLSSNFGVRGIPSLVIVDVDGSTITTEGQGAVSGDPEGLEFPWHPKPVADLKNGPHTLQEAPTVIALCEKSEPAVQKATTDAMTPIARRFLDAQKATGEDFPEFGFVVGSEAEGIAARLRELMHLPALLPSAGAVESSLPKLMLIDIPSDGAFYEGPEGEVTAESVEKLLADYAAGALERKQLKRG
jgi:nucleoredoxin